MIVGTAFQFNILDLLYWQKHFESKCAEQIKLLILTSLMFLQFWVKNSFHLFRILSSFGSLIQK